MANHEITCSRVLQFRAGPNEHQFFACEAHRGELVKGDAGGLFFPTADQPIREEEPDDVNDCYFCREG